MDGQKEARKKKKTKKNGGNKSGRKEKERRRLGNIIFGVFILASPGWMVRKGEENADLS